MTGGPRTAPPAIRVIGRSVAYGDRPAVAGVDLEVPAGGITAVVGPSGCGKSSLLLSLNRLTETIPGCTVGGRVEMDGLDIADEPVARVRSRVGTVFQQPNPFPLSIRRNLDLPLREHGVRDRAERAERMREVLEEVGLWAEVHDRLDAPAHDLSGGQQQRLCLARALTLRPRALLLDEPCSALDPVAGATVEDLIAGMRGRYTVVVVTHNLAQARRLADRVALLWLRDGVGRLVEIADADDFFERPATDLARDYVSGARG